MRKKTMCIEKRYISLFALLFFLLGLSVSVQAEDIEVNVFDGTIYSVEDIEIIPQDDFVILDIDGVGSGEENTPHFILQVQDGLFMVDMYGGQDIFISYIVANKGSPAAIVSGLVGSVLPTAIAILKEEFVDVKFLVLSNVFGGADVASISEAMQMIHEYGYGTYITADSVVESAGVDLFASGRVRYAEKGATVGIHNFAALGGEGQLESTAKSQELAAAANMQKLLKTFGVKDSFYTFMRSISAEELYYLSHEEMLQYHLINVAEESDFEEQMGVHKTVTQ